MQWIELKAQLTTDATETQVELVADAFSDAGVGGVAVDDPHLDPPEGWGPDAVGRPSVYGVSGYFADNPQGRQRMKTLRSQLQRLEQDLQIRIQILHRRLEESDWASAWKAHFHVQHVTQRLIIKPSWRDYEPMPGQLVIELDPGMAFGTGTHATTAQCLAMLETYLRPGDRLLDVGTGSGVLLIAAHKLGAAQVTGIDNDAVATEVAAENLRRNQVPKTQTRIVCADLLSEVKDRFNIVVANILTDVILTLLDDLPAVCKPGGLFVTSGIIDEHAKSVVTKLEKTGFELVHRQSRESWTCIVARFQND